MLTKSLKDEKAVRKMRERSSEVPPYFVKILERKSFKTEKSLEKQIRAEISRGNTVVIRGVEEAQPYVFSEENILDDRGLDHLKPYSLHSKFSWGRGE